MDFKQPSIITTSILLVLAGGIFYFLDLPQYEKDKAQKEKIDIFISQKGIKDEHTKKIAQIGFNLKDVNWEEKKKKIEPNFVSTPFFVPKMEVYFKDLVSRSGMALESVTFQGSSIATADQTAQTAQTAPDKLNPTEGDSANVPKNQSGVIGIKGPVKKNGFSLTVSGSYEDLKNLLAIFEKQAYLVSVKSISFGEGKGNQFSFSLAGDIYSY